MPILDSFERFGYNLLEIAEKLPVLQKLVLDMAKLVDLKRAACWRSAIFSKQCKIPRVDFGALALKVGHQTRQK